MSLLPVHWYYDTETGQLTQGNNLENLGNNLVGGAGWHELNIPGSATQAAAAAEARKEFPSGKPPTTAPITPARVAGTAAQEAGLGASGIWGSVPWLRIGEIILGLVLIAVGVAKMTDAVPAATRIAKAVS